MALMQRYKLSWQERSHGQLFCTQSANAILSMLLDECEGVDFQLDCQIEQIAFSSNYQLSTNKGVFKARSLVVATGGASIPKMGASNFALKIAQQFGLKTLEFTPALVPLVLFEHDMRRYFPALSGVSLEVEITCSNRSFREAMLITHSGLSGPVILQISSYWRKKTSIFINLLPNLNAADYLLNLRQTKGKSKLKNLLNEVLPKRLAHHLPSVLIYKNLEDLTLGEIKQPDLKAFGEMLNHWQITPQDTQGLRTAEACLGGVDTDEISSKTFECKNQKDLYFIGECVDVVGHLGGYNFQWAWSSAWAAAQNLNGEC
jgi:predicted Rossmann fold flavoprotein